MKSRKPRKDGRYSLNVSFTANELELIEWADKHGNFSAYVKDLIKQDMKKADAGTTEVERLLLKVLGMSNLKDNFQKLAQQETTVSKVEVEEAEDDGPKYKADAGNIKNLMKGLKSKKEW